MNIIIYTLIMTHITNVCFSLYVHRCIAHRAVEFNPVLQHFFRFWLWLTDGTQVTEWIAMHRRHHQFADRDGDPHSPRLNGTLLDKIVFNWKNFYFSVVYRYRSFASAEEIEFYSKGTPADWIERNLYVPYQRVGLLVMLGINIGLFGYWGLLVWLIQILWTPVWITVVITSFAHWWGYHNKKAYDNSGNLLPWGIVIAGEELHSNHHAYPADAKFSRQWYEFDLGWGYIQLFRFLGLAKVRYA